MHFTTASIVAILYLSAFSQAWNPIADKIDEQSHGEAAASNKGFARHSKRPRSLAVRSAWNPVSDKIDEQIHGAAAASNKGHARYSKRPRSLDVEDVAWAIYARNAAEDDLLEALYAREAEADPEAEAEAEWELFDWE